MKTKISYVLEIHVLWDFAFSHYTYRKIFFSQEEAVAKQLLYRGISDEDILYDFSQPVDDDTPLVKVHRKYHEWPVENLKVGAVIKQVTTEEVLSE